MSQGERIIPGNTSSATYYCIIQTMKKAIIILLSIIFLEYIVYNTLNGDTIALGAELHQIQEDIRKYTKANLLLREELFDLTSYTMIASMAASRGFIRENHPIYLHK
jgi:cell division protein FtsL